MTKQKTVEVSQKRVVIRGNLAAELFGEGTTGEVEEEVKKCMEIAPPGECLHIIPWMHRST